VPVGAATEDVKLVAEPAIGIWVEVNPEILEAFVVFNASQFVALNGSICTR
jgi:hypothetical protein